MRDDGNRPAGASGFPLVAVAAALWGTDALFRRGLALELPAVTVVFWEHVILVALTFPLLARIPWRRLDARALAALVLIGAGASAVATVLFTAAFRMGDPNTPLLLQKLQPVIAILLARVVLRERLRPVFAVYFVLALAAAWLITFPDPLAVERPQVAAGALACGAAALWGLGTVLGRYLSDRLRPAELTAARFAIGLPATLVLMLLVAAPGERAVAGDDVLALVLLALVPGLVSLLVYYRGLRRTPASAATVAELAFPVAALTVNRLAFGATSTSTQLVGLVVLAAVLVTMSTVGRSRSASLGVHVDVRTGPAHARPVAVER